MKHSIAAALVLLTLAGCGARGRGDLAFVGDPAVGYGYELWRDPSGDRVYVRRKRPLFAHSGGLGMCESNGYPVLEVARRPPRAADGQVVGGLTRAHLASLVSASRAQLDEALEHARKVPKPRWVEEFEDCIAGRR